jgi:hypothetical protein
MESVKAFQTKCLGTYFPAFAILAVICLKLIFVFLLDDFFRQSLSSDWPGTCYVPKAELKLEIFLPP